MSTVVSETQMVPVGDLRLADENPRYITPTRLDSLKKALESDPDMLQARPVIALPDGTVVAGNMRLRAVRDLGWMTIPCIYADLDAQRAKLWMLRDNNEYGDWGDASLATLLGELRDEGADMDLTGFDTHELNKFLKKLTPPPEEAEPQLNELVQYSIIVTCESEEHQAKLAASLEEQGLTIKMLMA